MAALRPRSRFGGLAAEREADAVHRPQEAGLLRALVEGGPDLGHDGRQRRLGDERARPQAVADALAGDHVGPLVEQQLQQLEGLGAEVALLFPAPELAGPAVEDEIAEASRCMRTPGRETEKWCEDFPMLAAHLPGRKAIRWTWRARQEGASHGACGRSGAGRGVAASRSWPWPRRGAASSLARRGPARPADSRAAIQQLSRLGRAGRSRRRCAAGSRAMPSLRGLFHFFDRSPDGLAAQRALVRRLPHGDGPLPALARQRRAALPVPPVAAPVRSPMPTIRSSGRSTRTTSARTARTPATSATCARTAWSGSPSTCRRT